MEERLKELEILWNRYLNTNAIEYLHKAEEINNSITFELCNETFPNICNEIITESIKRKYDLLAWEAKILMQMPNVMKAYQMFEYYTGNAVVVPKEGMRLDILIINVYDLIQGYATEIERLSNIIYREIPEEIREGDYDSIDRVLRLNVVCEQYEENYKYIRDLIKCEQEKEDKEKQSPALPEELDTEEGKAVLKRGVDGGILDNNYQLLKNTTNGQAAAFAICAKEMLGIEDHWKCFESLWGKKDMKSIKLVSTSEKKIKEVKKMFPPYIAHNALKDKH